MKSEYVRLLESDVFSQAPRSRRFVNAFYMESDQYEPYWQFGFFDDETNQIYAYVVKEDSIEALPSSEAMKEPDSYLQTLNLADVEVLKIEAEYIALDFVAQKYNLPLGSVKIFLLQNDTQFGQIWNITLVTATFDVVNVKIHGKTGDILFDKKHSLLDMNANKI
jgi:hypothetical protein